jgi:predicted N-formylglutamate amidohydrolase
MQVFVSCEHGGNRVPEKYRHLFAGRQILLNSHRGYDIGILPFAKRLAAKFSAPFLPATVTRLLIDLNRSQKSRSLFSELTRALSPGERQEILRLYHQPYWSAAEDIAAEIIATGRQVLHLSIHSFTPILNGTVRNADIGLLYDPKRPTEKNLCRKWQGALAACCPELRIRRNYPYQGNADALVTALRKRFPAENYLGIEMEINQRYFLENTDQWQAVQNQLLTTLGSLLQPRSLLASRPSSPQTR